MYKRQGGDEGAAEPLKGVRLLRVGAEHNGVGAELRGCGWREGPAGAHRGCRKLRKMVSRTRENK